MKNIFKSTLSLFSMLCLISLVLVNCTKPELDDDFPKGDPPPIGNFKNSSEVAPEDLVAYFPFDGNPNDSKGGVTGGTPHGNVTYTTGKKGQAYKGDVNAFIGYSNPGPLASLTSFTTSFWINTQKHDGGAQAVFTLTKNDGSFWGNFFVLIEGNTSSSDKMQLKLHFEKNVTPPVPNSENWIDPPADKRADNMYGGWKQVVYTYDAATSKIAFYANGQLMDIGADADRKSGNGTEGLGALAFKNATQFVIGGYQNHLGAPYGGIETWMLNYTGALDELRFYKRALTSQEVTALFQLEKQGR
jgi:Concanavalin A-like lectin/glucanases superfamily